VHFKGRKDLFTLEKRRLQEYLKNILSYIMVDNREEAARPTSGA